MNSALWDPVLKVFLIEFRTCGSHKQYMRPTIFQQNVKMHVRLALQMHTQCDLHDCKI